MQLVPSVLLSPGYPGFPQKLGVVTEASKCNPYSPRNSFRDNLGNLAYKIANEKHKTLRGLRPDLPTSATRIINKALQKDVENRYATGEDMARALNREILKKA